MDIEEIKYHPILLPCFLWYLKSCLMQPMIVEELLLHGRTRLNGVEITYNIDRSYRTLFARLEHEGVPFREVQAVIDEVIAWLLHTHDRAYLLDQPHELYVLPVTSLN